MKQSNPKFSKINKINQDSKNLVSRNEVKRPKVNQNELHHTSYQEPSWLKWNEVDQSY